MRDSGVKAKGKDEVESKDEDECEVSTTSAKDERETKECAIACVNDNVSQRKRLIAR